MRRKLVVAATAAVAVVAAGAGVGYLELSPTGSPHGSGRITAPTPPAAARSPVLAGLRTAASRPDPAAVARGLRRPAESDDLGGRLEGEVVDLAGDRLLWQRRAGVPAPPASTTKLLTSVAALSNLGSRATLQTTVVRQGSTLWLVGGGDVTLAASESANPVYPEPASLPSLARATAAGLKAAGLHRVRLRLDTTEQSGPGLAPGWRPTYVTEGDISPPSALEVDEGRPAPSSLTRLDDPATVAGQDFVADLHSDGIRVTGAIKATRAPATAGRLAAVSSPPVAALVQQMLTSSDDALAETLARSVARARHLPATFAGSAAAVLSAAAAAGVDVKGARLFDGSGLSHRDRIPPRTLISVLELVASGRRADLAAVEEGLPVAGFSGTLASRYRSHPSRPGAGVVRAKTGTLQGVSALAGFVVDRSGDLLGFALQAPHAPSAGITEPALDAIAATLARCGCRASPGA